MYSLPPDPFPAEPAPRSKRWGTIVVLSGAAMVLLIAGVLGLRATAPGANIGDTVSTTTSCCR